MLPTQCNFKEATIRNVCTVTQDLTQDLETGGGGGGVKTEDL